MSPGTFSSTAAGRSKGCREIASPLTSPAEAALMLLSPVATTVTVASVPVSAGESAGPAAPARRASAAASSAQSRASAFEWVGIRERDVGKIERGGSSIHAGHSRPGALGHATPAGSAFKHHLVMCA